MPERAAAAERTPPAASPLSYLDHSGQGGTGLWTIGWDAYRRDGASLRLHDTGRDVMCFPPISGKYTPFHHLRHLPLNIRHCTLLAFCVLFSLSATHLVTLERSPASRGTHAHTHAGFLAMAHGYLTGLHTRCALLRFAHRCLDYKHGRLTAALRSRGGAQTKMRGRTAAALRACWHLCVATTRHSSIPSFSWHSPRRTPCAPAYPLAYAGAHTSAPTPLTDCRYLLAAAAPPPPRAQRCACMLQTPHTLPTACTESAACARAFLRTLTRLRRTCTAPLPYRAWFACRAAPAAAPHAHAPRTHAPHAALFGDATCRTRRGQLIPTFRYLPALRRRRRATPHWAPRCLPGRNVGTSELCAPSGDHCRSPVRDILDARDHTTFRFRAARAKHYLTLLRAGIKHAPAAGGQTSAAFLRATVCALMLRVTTTRTGDVHSWLNRLYSIRRQTGSIQRHPPRPHQRPSSPCERMFCAMPVCSQFATWTRTRQPWRCTPSASAIHSVVASRLGHDQNGAGQQRSVTYRGVGAATCNHYAATCLVCAGTDNCRPSAHTWDAHLHRACPSRVAYG